MIIEAVGTVFKRKQETNPDTRYLIEKTDIRSFEAHLSFTPIRCFLVTFIGMSPVQDVHLSYIALMC